MGEGGEREREREVRERDERPNIAHAFHWFMSFIL